MRGFLLQDWTTMSGFSGSSGPPVVTSIPQGAASWLDIGDYEDLVFTLDVREATNANTQLVYETSPTKQDASFVAMLPAFSVAMGQRVDRVYTNMSAVPPARFVRWRITCIESGNYDLTFRIWLAAFAWVSI
jgi:hypothetical protein